MKKGQILRGTVAEKRLRTTALHWAVSSHCESVVCRGLVMPGATCLVVCLLPNSSIEQWRMVVIVTGNLPSVTSQYIVVPFATVMNVNYQRSRLGDWSKIEHSPLKQSDYNTCNCKNILQCVKTRY